MGQEIKLRRLTRGLLSLSLTGSAPSIAAFFVLYSPLKRAVDGTGIYGGVLAASAIAAVPASLVAVPADVVKKHVVLGIAKSPQAAAREIVQQRGVNGLFVGWQANVAKDVPFAVVKMALFEGI